MATFTNLGLAEPSTITARVATVQIARGSTNEQQEILVLGDPDSSAAIAKISSGAPATGDYGVVVRQVGYAAPSTTVNVSSLAGTVAVAQASTVWQVQVGGYVAPSTTVQVSSVGGVVSVAQNSTVWAVQVGGYVAPSTTAAISSVSGRVATAPNSTAWASSAGFHFDSSGALHVNVIEGAAGGSTQVSVKEILTSSGASVMDSTNGAIKVNVVAGSAAGDTTATVTQASTVWAVQVGGYVAPSTTVAVSSLAVSTGFVKQAGFSVDSSNYLNVNASVTTSTTVNVSSLAGVVSVAQNSTVWAVQVGGYSTTVNVSSVGGTVAAKAELANVQSTQYAQSTAFNNSTAITLQSSAAGQRAYVHAYSILTTIATAQVGGFYSSGTLIWPFVFQAVSSGVSGANLAVAQPGYLFRSNAAEELSIRIPGATNAGMNVGVSWFVST